MLIIVFVNNPFWTRRQPAFISSCCIYPLEQLTSWYSVIRLPDRFPPRHTCFTNHFQADILL